MRKQLTPFLGMCVFAMLLLSCQKDEQATPRSLDDFRIQYRAATGCSGHTAALLREGGGTQDSIGELTVTNVGSAITFQFHTFQVGMGNGNAHNQYWTYIGACDAIPLNEDGTGYDFDAAPFVHHNSGGPGAYDRTINTTIPEGTEDCFCIAARTNAGNTWAYGPYNAGEPTEGMSFDYRISCETICDECPECFADETGWSDGPEYEDGGQWATYTEYGEDNTVTLYAGQTHEAGTVHFSAVVDGMVTITITLEECWEFDDVDENVKIQGYDVAPTEEPVPGQFANKSTATDSPYSVDVPAAAFYGVHVDLLRPVECED